uniref:Ubiquitin-like protease family profile domain-containing protein n=1 Tax=Cucumis melo TaxID=3656 RepID=A0A9I9EL56_CUCME
MCTHIEDVAYCSFHWILHVIDLRENCVYVLDFLRSQVNEDIQGVINCSHQLDSVGCGYYVQKYTHEIVHNSSTSITSHFNTKSTYRQEEIDKIRTKWPAFVRTSSPIVFGRADDLVLDDAYLLQFYMEVWQSASLQEIGILLTLQKTST